MTKLLNHVVKNEIDIHIRSGMKKKNAKLTKVAASVCILFI